MPRAVHLLGLDQAGSNGREFWPLMYSVNYSESDIALEYPYGIDALKVTDRQPTSSAHLFGITKRQMHWLNFRVREIVITGGFGAASARHAWAGTRANFPSDERLLAGWPGCAIFDTGDEPGGTNWSLCLGYPMHTVVHGLSGGNEIDLPTGRSCPVLCDAIIYPNFISIGLPETAYLRNPPAAYFYDGKVWPYFRLEWRGVGTNSIFSTVAWESTGGRRETGYYVHLFDWDVRLPIWEFWGTEDPPAPTLEEDVSLQAASFFTYGGLYHPTTGKALVSPVPLDMALP